MAYRRLYVVINSIVTATPFVVALDLDLGPLWPRNGSGGTMGRGSNSTYSFSVLERGKTELYYFHLFFCRTWNSIGGGNANDLVFFFLLLPILGPASLIAFSPLLSSPPPPLLLPPIRIFSIVEAATTNPFPYSRYLWLGRRESPV